MRNRRREDEEDEKDELWILRRAPERNGQIQQRGKTNRQPGPMEMPLGNLEELWDGNKEMNRTSLKRTGIQNPHG
jgi:hypothetical protein